MTEKYASFGKQRANKLWEGHRMIIPEHRSYMLEIERRQEQIKRPHLDEEKLQDMSIALSQAILDQRLVTLVLYTPYELQERTILPKRIGFVDQNHQRLFSARRADRELAYG